MLATRLPTKIASVGFYITTKPDQSELKLVAFILLGLLFIPRTLCINIHLLPEDDDAESKQL